MKSKNINIQRRRVLSAVSMASIPFVLSACKSEDKSPAAATTWRDGGIKDAVNAFAQVEGVGKGISVGDSSAPRTAYVFFDPRCHHCAKLWSAAGPIVKEGKVRFVWLPVGLVSKESLVVSAAIYESKNQIAAMEENERSVEEKTGGLKLSALPSEQAMDVVKNNGRIAEMIGLEEVPIMLIKDSKGRPILTAGSMDTAVLRSFLAR